ncbi:MAG: hypothetical protein Q8L88_06050, partial [Bacteroidota bacterium]|nr:hypothetical protein [Bacteroidota bacterium]
MKQVDPQKCNSSKSLLFVRIIVLLFCGILIQNSYSQAPGPLRVHPSNPRYFADASGKIVYLTGSHTWSNFQDNGNGNP